MTVDEIFSKAAERGGLALGTSLDTILHQVWECVKANDLAGARDAAITMTAVVMLQLSFFSRVGSIEQATKIITDEFIKATQKHGPMHSAHEGYAIILEEYEEYCEEVDLQKAANELAQTGAMAVRFLIDVTTERGMKPVHQPCERCKMPVDIRGPHLSHAGGKVSHLHGDCPTHYR